MNIGRESLKVERADNSPYRQQHSRDVSLAFSENLSSLLTLPGILNDRIDDYSGTLDDVFAERTNGGTDENKRSKRSDPILKNGLIRGENE